MSKDTESNKIVEELYIEMYPKLFMYASSALNDRHLAEEAVQETFRIACAKPDRLMESKNRQGWLTNTLKYVISNTRRSQDRLRNLLVTLMTAANIPAGLSENNVELEIYCTSVLGKEDFELIKRLAVENDSMLEAARELGISVDACRKRVQRARKKLKDAISENL